MLKILFVPLVLFLNCTPSAAPASSPTIENDEPRIQIAVLLDTSNSMDGLIDQAKSQLWKLVNTLASGKRDGKSPKVEIALFEYGKSSISVAEGYVKEISPLTQDLDLVSKELFALKTNGGDEYCGWVIKDALSKLKWSDSPNDLKVIFIAGNEPFNQGKVDFRESCRQAVKQAVVINTIHCGDCAEGENTFWKEGADIGKGEYMCINTDARVVHVPTPYDDQIIGLNSKLNDTYIGYGSQGAYRKEMQVTEDANAKSYGESNVAQRAVSKSAKGTYKNDSWDMVDAYDSDKKFVEKVKSEELPAELKGKSSKEIEAFILGKKTEREKIKAEILEMNKKAEAHREAELKKMGEGGEETLDKVMNKAIKSQAKSKKFEFE